MRNFRRLGVAILLIVAMMAAMMPVSFAAGELTYTQSATPTFAAGTSHNEITIDLTNGGVDPITSITIKPSVLTGVVSSVSAEGATSIAAGYTDSVDFTLAISAAAVAGDYTLPVEIDYVVNSGAPQTLNATLAFSVTAAAKLSGSVSNNRLPAGGSSNLTLTLKNNSAENYTDMSVSLDGLNGAGVATTGVNSYVVGGLSSGESKTATFGLAAGSGATAGYYEITALVKYKDGAAAEKHEEIQFFVQITESGSPSSIDGGSVSIDSVNVNRQTVKSGDTLQLSVRVRNDSPKSVSNIKVAVEAEAGLSNMSAPTVVISKLSSDSYYTVDFDYMVDKDIKTKFYSLDITLSYSEGGKAYTYDWTSGVYVRNAEKGEAADTITLGEVVVSPKEILAEGEFSASVVVRNYGTEPVYNLAVSATPDAGVVNKTQNTVMIGTIEAGGSRTVNFTFLSRSTAATGNYMVNFTANYQLKSGDAETARSLSQYGGVFIRNPKLDAEDDEEGDAPKSRPIIIIDEYKIEPTIVNAGKEFDLSMTFRNTNSQKAVRNIKINLTVSETTEKSGTVFTPVGSSNTFYIDALSPKGTTTRELRFYTVPDAVQKTYTVLVNFEYEDAEGNPYTGTDQIGIPVRQECKMSFGQMYGPEQIGWVGQQSYVSLEFYNTGKQTMYNLMVRFESDDFESTNPIYYVGNFDPGGTDYFETSMIPNMAGVLNGKILFEFEDAAANPITIEKEFTMEVQEMMMEPFPPEGGEFPMDPEFVDPSPGGIMGFIMGHLWWLIGGFVLLVVGLIIFLRAMRIRKRRQMDMEDDLAFADANGRQDQPEDAIPGETADSTSSPEGEPVPDTADAAEIENERGED